MTGLEPGDGLKDPLSPKGLMTTDLEIARAAKMEPIEAVAWKLGISAHELTPMGNGVAKVSWQALKDRFSKPQGSLVLVTSVNPTPFGEGKTVTTIGLTPVSYTHLRAHET